MRCKSRANPNMKSHKPPVPPPAWEGTPIRQDGPGSRHARDSKTRLLLDTGKHKILNVGHRLATGDATAIVLDPQGLSQKKNAIHQHFHAGRGHAQRGNAHGHIAHDPGQWPPTVRYVFGFC